MADASKRRRLILPIFLIAGILVLIPFSLVYLHLGPRFGKERDTQNRASLVLADGSRLVLTQRREDSLIDAYSTTLYRYYPSGRVEQTGLGGEDSFWWGGLRFSRDTNTVEVYFLWSLEATYDQRTRITSIPGRPSGIEPSLVVRGQNDPLVP